MVFPGTSVSVLPDNSRRFLQAGGSAAEPPWFTKRLQYTRKHANKDFGDQAHSVPAPGVNSRYRVSLKTTLPLKNA